MLFSRLFFSFLKRRRIVSCILPREVWRKNSQHRSETSRGFVWAISLLSFSPVSIAAQHVFVSGCCFANVLFIPSLFRVVVAFAGSNGCVYLCLLLLLVVVVVFPFHSAKLNRILVGAGSIHNTEVNLCQSEARVVVVSASRANLCASLFASVNCIFIWL